MTGTGERLADLNASALALRGADRAAFSSVVGAAAPAAGLGALAASLRDWSGADEERLAFAEMLHVAGHGFGSAAMRRQPPKRFDWGVPTTVDKPIVMIAISNICNLNCTICETQDSEARKGNMDKELFVRIIDELQSTGHRWVSLHNVNEPLLHPHIFDFLRMLEERDMNVILSTNGNGLDKALRRLEKREWLPRVLRVRFSIDGATPETYRAIRVGGELSRVVEGFHLLDAFCQERGIRLELSSNYVMTSKSLHEVATFHDLFGHRIAPETMSFSVVNGNTPTGLNKFIIENRVTDFVRRVRCNVPHVLMNIQRDGRVSLCCMDFNEKAIVGDVRTTPIADIFTNGEEMARYRKALDEDDVEAMHPICRSCYMATANLAGDDLQRVVQSLLVLKEKGFAVTNTSIVDAVRHVLGRYGLDYADPRQPVRLFDAPEQVQVPAGAVSGAPAETVAEA